MSQFLAFDHNPYHVLVPVVSHLQIESFLSLMKPRHIGYLLSQRIVDLTVSTCHAALLALMARHICNSTTKTNSCSFVNSTSTFPSHLHSTNGTVVGPNASLASSYALPLPFYVLG